MTVYFEKNTMNDWEILSKDITLPSRLDLWPFSLFSSMLFLFAVLGESNGAGPVLVLGELCWDGDFWREDDGTSAGENEQRLYSTAVIYAIFL